jgi:hypothetical protein
MVDNYSTFQHPKDFTSDWDNRIRNLFALWERGSMKCLANLFCL